MPWSHQHARNWGTNRGGGGLLEAHLDLMCCPSGHRSHGASLSPLCSLARMQSPSRPRGRARTQSGGLRGGGTGKDDVPSALPPHHHHRHHFELPCIFSGLSCPDLNVHASPCVPEATPRLGSPSTDALESLLLKAAPVTVCFSFQCVPVCWCNPLDQSGHPLHVLLRGEYRLGPGVLS